MTDADFRAKSDELLTWLVKFYCADDNAVDDQTALVNIERALRDAYQQGRRDVRKTNIEAAMRELSPRERLDIMRPYCERCGEETYETPCCP